MEEKSERSGRLLEDFIPQLKTFVETETVFGRPVSIGEITLIPVQTVKVGFGMGSGEPRRNDDGKASAGGGGVSMSPLAVIVVKDGFVSVQSLNASNVEGILEKVPDFLEKITLFVKKALRADQEKKEG